MSLPPIDLASITAGTGGFVIHGVDNIDVSGFAVASAGDIDGDGFDDIIIGSYRGAGAGNLKTFSGEAYVVFGKAGGFGAPIQLADITAGTGGFALFGADAGDSAGFAVSSAGDVNGDGFADLLIGAVSADGPDNTVSSVGEVYVVFGSAGGFTTPVDLGAVAAGTGGFAIFGQDTGDRIGVAIASAGDINGDGLDDIVLGAQYAAGPGNAASFSGESYVVFGRSDSSGAPVSLADVANGTGGFVLYGQDGSDQAGNSVAAAGDVNGDGIDDLVIGARAGDGVANAANTAGETYVLFGRTDGFAASAHLGDVANGTAGFVIFGRDANDTSGSSVASAGDVNGDGFADLVIGAPFGAVGTDFASSPGETYVVFGHAGGFGASIQLAEVALGTGGFMILGQDATDRSGGSVASAGDLNGDGFDDLVIGAIYGDGAGNAEATAGETYVVFGKAAGFGAVINLTDIANGTGGFVIFGEDTLDRSGRAVASAGDVDGDGFDDLVIGAPSANGPENLRSDTGGTYVIFGRDFTGSVTAIGTDAAETLDGTAGADSIVAGQGDDILRGLGGADALGGGAGDDRLLIGDLGFIRVDGGSGTDTLALDTAGTSLDVTAIAGTRIQGIEVIDLTGTGDNNLVLNRLAVLNLSDTSNTLTVTGDVGDAVDLGAGTWSQGGSAGGFTTYTNGLATLRLADTLGVLCFCAGSMILTPGGEVAVEHLAIGDLVVTQGGRVRPVTWIGSGQAHCTRFRRTAATPVIVRKGALADNVPHRDLRITRGHSLYLGGVLIPVEFLINHRSIHWDDLAEAVTIHHVELDGHDVLIANGAPAESYRDDGNRWLFRNANPAWDMPAHPPCAPILTGGPVVDAVWRRLCDRADPAPRQALTEDPDLHLLVDGQIVAPVLRSAAAGAAARYLFRLDGPPVEVRLVSRADSPARVGIARDDRVLGVALRQVLLWHGAGLRLLAADDPRLDDGFHPFEVDADLRWTKGNAALPGDLFDAWDGPVEVDIRLGAHTRYPSRSEAQTAAPRAA